MTGAIFRCVCGLDLPLVEDAEIACTRCGTVHRPQAATGSPAETAVLAENGSPRAPGRPGSAAAGDGLMGQTFDHFRILNKLGEGGVGTVYRALDTSLERQVALKVLNEEGDPAALEAFVHEARAQARLSHPGIATIYYIGRRAQTPYFAMEYVPGESLDVRVARGPLPPSEVVRIGLQAVRSLREASEQGITHRDIKPGNFILSRSGTLKLTDFGLSKTERGGLQITGSRAITGTPHYIAPEQARGESTDLRTDIYSLGAMLYHLAYGRPPFEADGFLNVISRHLGSPLEFPDPPPADLPAGFPSLIARMMQKEPRFRFQDYRSLERALHELLPELQVAASIFRRAIAMALEAVALVTLVLIASGVFSLLQNGLSRDKELFAWVYRTAGGLALLALLLCQLLRGRTPGKEFARLRIAAIRGGRPGRGALAARWCFQWLPLFAPGLSFLLVDLLGRALVGPLLLAVGAFWIVDCGWALTGRRRRTLHDLATGTWVLEDMRGPDPA
jgi:uncharacterized RDD family membrane protein YckC